MTAEILATCSVMIPAGVPDEVHLLPMGTVKGRDGGGPYTVRDKAHAERVIAATKAYQRGADLPVDYEHQSQRAPRHVQPRPAAGWIKWNSLKVGPNGIWGKVQWTATASANLGERAYRYFSPVFMHSPDGSVLRIVGGALTNFPNLELTALASQGATMTGDTLTSAKTLLGLDGADDSTFLRVCDGLAKIAQALAKHLGLPPETGPAGVLDALAQKAGGQPATATASQSGGSSVAALEAIQAIASQAETYRQQLSQAQVDKIVTDAMSAGQVSPAMKPWAVALASQSPESFEAFRRTMPPVFSAILKSDFANRSAVPPVGDGAESQLTPGQMAVCSQMGLSPDDYLKTMKG